jgi:hypothetical protein
MNLLTLNEDAGLHLVLINGEAYVTAVLTFRDMQIAVATCRRSAIHAMASGASFLALGDVHFPLAHDHLKQAADILGVSVRGDAS